MKALLIFPLLAASLSAVTFTPISPTPHAGEVDLADIIAPYEAAGFVRIPDDLDTVFPVAGYGPLYIVAWEDLPLSIADNDFNDVVLSYDSLTHVFEFLAGYSADTHTWYEASGVLYLDSGQTCCGTGDFSSLSSPDRMVTWGKPLDSTTSVPEAGSVALLGGGLLALVAFARRRA